MDLTVQNLTVTNINHKDSYLLVDESYRYGIGQFCIMIPSIKTGSYSVTLYSGDLSDEEIDGSLLFSFKVDKIGDTMNITYGRISESISEFRVAKNGQIHILTKYGRKLYYSIDTQLYTSHPQTDGAYPYDDDDYIYEYMCGKEHANIYTSWDGIDILGEESNIGDSELTLTNTNNISNVSSTTGYNPYSGNKVYRTYLPNQNLNKDSNVEFSSIKLPLSDGFVGVSNGVLTHVDLDSHFATQEELNEERAQRRAQDTIISSQINSILPNAQTYTDTQLLTVESEYEEADNAVLNEAKEYADGISYDDTELRTDLTDESNTRANADTALGDRITTLSNSVESELSELRSLVTTLSQKVTTLENALSNKQDVLTFSSPLTKTNNTVSLNENNLLHKSGNETITGNKTVEGVMKFTTNAPEIPTSTPLNALSEGALFITQGD